MERIDLEPSEPHDRSAARAAGSVFEREALIRFAHCDPAGIVFFPQYLVMVNGLVEDWFDDGLGLGYAHVVGRRRIGLPTVALNCRFTAPSRMGERVWLSLAVRRLGNSSITLELACRHGAQDRFLIEQVLVTTSLDTGRPIPIPDDIRAAARWFVSFPGDEK